FASLYPYATLFRSLDEAAEGAETLGQALGVVEAVDADGELAPAQAVAQRAHRGLVDRGRRLLGDAPGVDADRERPDRHPAAAGQRHRAIGLDRGAAEDARIGAETVGIA